MATSNANGTRRNLGGVRYRKNIRHLTDRELNDLRVAFERLYAISATTTDGVVDPAGNANDERGYQWVAGVHGAPPPVYCQHGTIHFTTWHRAYLYRFEKLLQRHGVDTVMLPWWDWSDEDSLAEGLPEAVTAATYTDLDSGEEKPNPLFSAYSQARRQMTTRDPRPVAGLEPIAGALQFAMAQIEYPDFVSTLENPHGLIHVWVGGGTGDMGSVPTAAYDPVFWLHHCNVDRYWSMWQQEHPNAGIPEDALAFVAAPFNMTGESVMSIKELGYSYADDETLISADDVRAAAEVLGVPDRAEDEVRPNVTFELDPVPRRYRRATLELVALRPPVDSYLAHIYLNNPDATLETPRTMDEGYAGLFSLFGHGPCLGGPGHCDVVDPVDAFDLLPQHHKAPADAHVDISFPLASVVSRDAGDGDRVPLTATLVVENAAGQPADPDVLRFEAIAVVVRA